MEVLPGMRDVSQIIYKYIHRYYYNRCVEEYNRIYGPHWKNDSNTFSYCTHDYEQCPILMNGCRCVFVMYRSTSGNTYNKHVFRIQAEVDNAHIVAKLPDNY